MYNDIGLHSPNALYRVVEGIEGEVALTLEAAVRPEYGLTTPLVRNTEPGVWRTRGGPLTATISVDDLGRELESEFRDGVLRGRFVMGAGERAGFAMCVGDPWHDPPSVPADVFASLDDTVAGWQSWAKKLIGYEGEYRDVLRRSAVVLRALNYAPTGAIVAAPTTSLPEEIGGVRNWDYRYTWVRDMSFTIGALAASGCGFEAGRFFDFMTTATAGSLAAGEGLQIMYGIHGDRFIPEQELPHLAGHRGSRPVRIGNGAWDQSQLDVYGELLDAAFTISELDIEIDPEFASFLADVADRAVLRWEDVDEGIWEVRGGAGHFLYSKVMNWVALDRAVRLASMIGAADDQVARWGDHRDRIRAAILEQGWSEAAGAFSQAFGRDDLDASALMMAIVGFLPATDPRMRSTIEAIADRLTDERGFVYRYLNEDGLPGGEGTFGICTFWLAECLASAGEVDRAASCSRAWPGARTTSGSSRKRSTPRPASSSGTSRRRSPTSVSCTPRSPSSRPHATDDLTRTRTGRTEASSLGSKRYRLSWPTPGSRARRRPARADSGCSGAVPSSGPSDSRSRSRTGCVRVSYPRTCRSRRTDIRSAPWTTSSP